MDDIRQFIKLPNPAYPRTWTLKKPYMSLSSKDEYQNPEVLAIMEPIWYAFLIAVAFLAISRIAWHVAYEAFFGPLSKIPNAHVTASISSTWLMWIKWKQTENRTMRDLHNRLGPVLRVGPNEINVNCYENGLQVISGAKFLKSEWYSGFFDNYHVAPLFSLRDHHQHAERRRIIWSSYSKSTVSSSEHMTALLDSKIKQQFIGRLRSLSLLGCPIEIFGECRAVTVDLVSAWLFGNAGATNLVGDESDRAFYSKYFDSSLSGVFFTMETYNVARYLRKFELSWLSSTRKAMAQVKETEILRMCNASCSTDINKSGTVPVSSQLRNGLSSKGRQNDYGDREVACEMMEELIAGQATGAMFMYAILHISQEPRMQHLLRKEIQQVGVAALLTSPQVMDDLPVLEAITAETLRLHADAKGPFGRVVPDGGARIGNYENVPTGTVVAASIYCMHHEESVFERPDEWMPDRWLHASPEHLKTMRKWFCPFFGGVRGCIASHFALRAMKTFIACLYDAFETRLDQVDDMEQTDSAVAVPIGRKFHVHCRDVRQ